MNSECWRSGRRRTGPSASTKSAPRGADLRVAVPLRTRTEIMGILLLGPSGNDVRSGAMERHVLRNCADQFALMMENARLTDRVVGQEALRRDLALAAEVQKRLLPSIRPRQTSPSSPR